MNTTYRIADADESCAKIDFEGFNKSYRNWLIRRGFTQEVQQMDRFSGIAKRCQNKKKESATATKSKKAKKK